MPRSAVLSAATLVVIIVTSLVTRGPDVLGQIRRELRIGAPGVPAALDPAVAVDGTGPLIARHVFDTLVAFRDRTTDVEPALATRWKVSRDGLVWTFTLREDARFHDGAPLTAADVVASFERHLRSEGTARSPVWATLLRGVPGVVKEIRAGEGRTVHFVLVQPYAPLLTVLAHPGFGVVRTVTHPDGPRLVGTGPYRIVDASAGRLALEAVPGYWGGPPRADRLVFLEMAADEHAEAELDARGVDVWFPASVPRRSELTLSIPGTQVGYLAFQTEKEPFSRRAIRQALAAALDPAVLATGMDRFAVPLQSFLPPGIWGRREGSPVLGGGTREKVRRLLTEGGWPKDFKPTLLFATEPSGLARGAVSIQTALVGAEIGVQLRPESPDAVRAALQAGQHELALVEGTVVGGDPHLFLYPLSTSEGAIKGPRALNYSFYRNPRLDELLARASQLSFRVERERLYQRAQGILAQDVPWLPIYVRLLWAAARPEVRGLRLHPTGFHRLTGVWIDAGPGGQP